VEQPFGYFAQVAFNLRDKLPNQITVAGIAMLAP